MPSRRATSSKRRESRTRTKSSGRRLAFSAAVGVEDEERPALGAGARAERLAAPPAFHLDDPRVVDARRVPAEADPGAQDASGHAVAGPREERHQLPGRGRGMAEQHPQRGRHEGREAREPEGEADGHGASPDARDRRERAQEPLETRARAAPRRGAARRSRSAAARRTPAARDAAGRAAAPPSSPSQTARSDSVPAAERAGEAEAARGPGSATYTTGGSQRRPAARARERRERDVGEARPPALEPGRRSITQQDGSRTRRRAAEVVPLLPEGGRLGEVRRHELEEEHRRQQVRDDEAREAQRPLGRPARSRRGRSPRRLRGRGRAARRPRAGTSRAASSCDAP